MCVCVCALKVCVCVCEQKGCVCVCELKMCVCVCEFTASQCNTLIVCSAITHHHTHRALLQKRPIILRSLLIIATPYQDFLDSFVYTEMLIPRYQDFRAILIRIHVDRKKKTLPGGFPIYYDPSSRTVSYRNPLEAPGTNSSMGVLLLTVLDEGT